MLKSTLAVLPAVLLICACATVPVAESPLRESSPQRAFVYFGGDVVLEEQLDQSRLVRGSILLPSSLDTQTISLSQNGKRLKYFVIEKIKMPMQTAPEGTTPQDRYLLNVPEYDKHSPIQLRYTVDGIRWKPRLDVEIKDGQTLEVNLNAVITTGRNELKHCDITLVYAGSGYDTRAASQRYPIGALDLLAEQTVIYLLESTSAPYRSYFTWDADAGDAVKPVVAFANPLQTFIRSMPYILTADNTIINRGDIRNLESKATLELPTGTEELVATFRRAVTKEDTAKKILPFTHEILYRVINNRDSDILVRMYCAKRIGSGHRNVYHFATEPTSRPGGDLVWLLTVPKGDTKDISFNFDSDDKNFREYLRYDEFDGGR